MSEAIVNCLVPLVGNANVTMVSRAEGAIGVVTPETQEQMAAVVAVAQGQRWKMAITGNGSKCSWGETLAACDLRICTQKLDRLVEHAVGDLTVTVEAGMPWARLQSILAQAQQFLALDPPHGDRATVGGVVATGESGSLRHRYHSVRDQVLGIQFVRSDGQWVKAGGRVVKNVAGFDLMKLLTGSYGTLGLITQVTFRLYPLPPDRRGGILWGEPEALTRLRSQLLTAPLTPSRMDLCSPALLTRLGLPSLWGIAVGVEGIAASTIAQMQLLQQLAQGLGLTFTPIEDTEVFWQNIQRQFWQQDQITTKIGIPSDQALALLHPIGAMQFIQVHLGSGLGLIQWTGIETPWEQLLHWRQSLATQQGFLVVLDAPPTIKQRIPPWNLGAESQKLGEALRQQFDPQGLFNPHASIGSNSNAEVRDPKG